MYTKARLFVVLAFVACLCSTALADNLPLITVNENGQGTLDFTSGGGGVTPLVGKLLPDPGPGGPPSVLTYNLLGPPSLVAGDVLLQDGVSGPILDVVRFNPAGTGGISTYPASLLFYSDNIDGFDSLGDTTAPPRLLYSNVVTILETGTEGNNGAFYTPLANQPGFVPGFAVSYNLQSDVTPVPEPETFSLLGISIVGLVAMFRKYRQQT
jgi:hypothetical protein